MIMQMKPERSPFILSDLSKIIVLTFGVSNVCLTSTISSGCSLQVVKDGNQVCSSNRYEVARSLWKSQRALPVAPDSNPNLVPLRVLCKQSDGYHDVGNVYSLCKPGKDKDWLKDVVYSRRVRKSKTYAKIMIGQQIVSDDDGVLAKALVGPVNAAAWFTDCQSIEVCIPECEILEFNKAKWESEVMDHFDPNMGAAAILGSWFNGMLDLFIVQKVLLVPQIKITASYSSDARPEFKSPVTTLALSESVKVEASFQDCPSSEFSTIGVFTLTATQKDQKLPVAFSGFTYTYDKFGVREHFGTDSTRSQPDGDSAGESSSGDASQTDPDSHNDDPQDDPDMGRFLDGNDWFANIMAPNPNLEIYPNLEDPEEPLDAAQDEEEEEEDSEDEDDENAPGGMEDID